MHPAITNSLSLSLSFSPLLSLLTFYFLLSHNSVTEGQCSEEGVDLHILQLHSLHQGVVMEGELMVSKRVEGPVHCLRVLVDLQSLASVVKYISWRTE